ncbi:adhesion G protein-coupled receptor L1-like isoform X1 [Mya arenaria]|uniref:adhesion G protein-coupled receptor L1-like isoform X1 n=1 Tax=Mya arenaria TaxID=6604 RepID=UPI0022E36D0B|nr:adhesion G protein-coupled receptor L1-like isoform X1 [Mya arenaria]
MDFKNLWIFILLIILKEGSNAADDSSSEEEIICAEPWTRIHRSCIFNNSTLTSQKESAAMCDSMGGYLLVISNVAERQGVVNEIKRLVNTYRSTDYLNWWVGLKFGGEPAQWSWFSEEEFNTKLTDWAPAQSGAPADCAMFDYQGYLLEEDCELQHPFICEQNRTALTTTTAATTSTTTVAPVTTTGEMVTEQESTSGEPEISTERTGQPTTQHTTPDVGPNQTTRNHTDEPTELPDVSNQTSGTPRPDGDTSSTQDPGVSTTGQPDVTDPANQGTTTDGQGDSGSESTPKPDVPSGGTRPSNNVTGNPNPTNRPTQNPNITTDNSSQPTDRTDNPDVPTGRTQNPNRPTDRTPNPNKPTDRPPNTNKPTSKTSPPTPTTPSAEREREIELEKFKDCYAVNYESTCPPVQAFGISWPRSNPGPVQVQCEHGNAMWHCSRNPVVCWRREPNVQQCTSPAVQNLTRQSEAFLEDPGNAEAALAFTGSLAAASETPAMSEQDLYQTTVLLETAGRARPNNASQAKTIIKDVLKCGSGLVANDKKSTWAGMEPASQRIVAASLMRSVENVTLAMAETFTEPGVQTIEDENIAAEVHVLSMANTLPGEGNVKFQREDNSFYIPEENLLAHSSGGVSRAVFLEYRTFGGLLEPDPSADVTSERRVASRVLSATLGGTEGQVQLTEPVIIAFKTEKVDGVERYQHKCSFWNYSLGFSGSWSQKGCALDKTNDTHTLCRCDHLTSFAVLMDIHKTEIKGVHAMVLSYITYAGIIISAVCCFFSWLTFVCLSCRCIKGHRSSADERGNSGGSNYAGSASRSVHGERNSIHKHLVFTIFVAEILFLAGIQRTDDKIACAVIAGVLHFFFTSSFFWMFLEGIHILFMLVQVFDAARSRVKYYYLVGYGFPLLIVGISALVYHDGYGTEKYCWLTSDRMFLWSFAGPVAFILLVNLLILIYAMTAVCKHSEYVFTKDKSPTGNIRAWIQGALALEVLLGLTWVFGFFYISEEALPFAYLFTIFNSLQGLFIFVFHCVLNKKIRKEYARFIDYQRRPSSSGTHSSKANASGHSNGLQLHRRSEPGFYDLSKTANGTDRRTSTDA